MRVIHLARSRAALFAAVVALLAVTAAACGGGGNASGGGGSSSTGGLTIGGNAAHPPSVPAGSTLLATIHHRVQSYVNPRGVKGVIIPAAWHGAVSTLPVVTAQPGWLDVRLAQRPNESTAWIKIADATLTSSPYKILIDLATERLFLFRSDKVVYAAPVGIGTSVDPTPTGHYFVAFLAEPPAPGYGPFVLVSSAHSDTISDWESSGDALMAIHGPLGSDAQIGTTGAQVSHGCVRLHANDLAHLRVVPAGSPIVVVAS
ncbi:MAG TPA: L,D-transpeptidase [Acidimicrobiales bacterium]|nr:L,D-transpeptidase [Acidimicrobiales bacterium]